MSNAPDNVPTEVTWTRDIDSQSWAEIDLQALTHNACVMKARIGEKGELMAIVKSDAYGHGLVRSAQAALRGGASRLAVGNLAEARALRESGCRASLIKIIPSIREEELSAGIALNLEEIAINFEQACLISTVAQRAGAVIRVHVKVDTGMGRLGIWWSDAVKIIAEIQRLPGLQIVGIMSHLPEAEAEDGAFTYEQIARFRSIMESLGHFKDSPCFHLANSAGGLYLPATHFNAIRSGIALYGLSPRGKPSEFENLRPVMSVKTQVLQVKTLPAGESVGYGRTIRISKPARIAILPIGYADGYPRAMSNRGYVLIRGARAPIIGIVSMNLTAVDVTLLPAVQFGDETVLIGRQDGEEISANDLANFCGTINYEIVTRLGKCCRRIYFD